MGRELKRVSLDFDWKLNKTWEGYLNPFYTAKNCIPCEGEGYSPEAKLLRKKWYGYVPFKPEDRGSVPFSPNDPNVRKLAERNVNSSPDYYLNPLLRVAKNQKAFGIFATKATLSDLEISAIRELAITLEAQRLCDQCFNHSWSHHLNDDDVDVLIAEDRLHDFTHDYIPYDKNNPDQKYGWVKKENFVKPTARQVNEWSCFGFGHDGINQHIVVQAECERLGVPWKCPDCNGEGEVWNSPEDKISYEEWEKIEPPKGEGYQIWETVSEGSPITPVFATPEELAEYMSHTTWGADKGTSYESWMKFIEGPGWAPSLIICNNEVKTGVEGIN